MISFVFVLIINHYKQNSSSEQRIYTLTCILIHFQDLLIINVGSCTLEILLGALEDFLPRQI